MSRPLAKLVIATLLAAPALAYGQDEAPGVRLPDHTVLTNAGSAPLSPPAAEAGPASEQHRAIAEAVRSGVVRLTPTEDPRIVRVEENGRIVIRGPQSDLAPEERATVDVRRAEREAVLRAAGL